LAHRRSLRSGRDDKGAGYASIESGCRTEGEGWRRTAGPSAPLRSGRDDKGEGYASIESGCRTEGEGWRRTAGPSAPLRSGRDDKGVGETRPPFDLYRCRNNGDSAARSKVASRAMFSQANQSPQRE
jgi:hypothetical protein